MKPPPAPTSPAAEERRERRVLITAPSGRDGEVLVHILKEAGFQAEECPSLQDLVTEMSQGAGAAVLAGELVAGSQGDALIDALKSQPEWSDFPLLLMTTGETERLSRELAKTLEGRSQPILLQRPVRKVTLVSSLSAALQSRQRQYQVRDELRQRREAERALRESEAKLRFEREKLNAIIEQAPIGISIAEAPSGRSLVLNDKGVELLGHPQPGEEVDRYRHYGAIHPDGRPYEIEDYPTVRALRTGERIEEEMRYRHGGEGGEVRRLSVSSAPVRDETGKILASVTAFVDVEEQKRAEEALRHSREELQLISDNIPAFIAYVDHAQRYVWTNRTYRDFFQRSEDEIVGLTVRELMGQKAYAQIQPRLEAALQGEEQAYEFEMESPGVRSQVVSVTYIPHFDGTEVTGCFVLAIDITKRKLTEAALRESEAKLRRIFRDAPVFIAVHEGPDHRFVFVNPLHDEATGNRPVLGKPLREAVPEVAGQGIVERYDEVYRSGEPITVPEFQFRLDPGVGGEPSTGYYRQILQPWFDADESVAGVMSFAFDITEQVEAREALRRGEERLRLAAQATGFGTYDFNVAEGRSIWSREMAIISGVARTEMPGQRSIHRLVHPDDREKFDEVVKKALDPSGAGRHRVEYRIVRPDGQTRWVRDIGVTFFKDDGTSRRAVRVVGTVEDITSRKKAEEKLQASLVEKDRLLAELREAQDELVRRERLATLGQLAGGVAHELRTPLGVIRNSVYYLEATAGKDDRELTELLGELKRAIASSDHIIGEMLDYVREPSHESFTFSLDEPIERALKLARIPENITVERSGSGESIEIEGHPEQFTQILTNLVQNAVQAMPEGGELGIGVSREDDSVTVEVRDTGHGISAEDRRKIFDPLFTTKTRGIGLGLAISQRYAELHGGRLEVESEPGSGSVFRMILPNG